MMPTSPECVQRSMYLNYKYVREQENCIAFADGLMTLDWKWCGAVVAINGSTKSVKMYPLERTVALIGTVIFVRVS